MDGTADYVKQNKADWERQLSQFSLTCAIKNKSHKYNIGNVWGWELAETEKQKEVEGGVNMI
jgi:hypothetical protein